MCRVYGIAFDFRASKYQNIFWWYSQIAQFACTNHSNIKKITRTNIVIPFQEASEEVEDQWKKKFHILGEGWSTGYHCPPCIICAIGWERVWVRVCNFELRHSWSPQNWPQVGKWQALWFCSKPSWILKLFIEYIAMHHKHGMQLKIAQYSRNTCQRWWIV